MLFSLANSISFPSKMPHGYPVAYATPPTPCYRPGSFIWRNMATASKPVSLCSHFTRRFIYFNVMCLHVLSACMDLHHGTWYPWRSKENIRFLEAGLRDGCELQYGFLKMNPDPLQDEQALLTIWTVTLAPHANTHTHLDYQLYLPERI